MPWFITSIIDKGGRVAAGDSRTFGFKNTYWEARVAINQNEANMRECLYDYLVLEYIEAGIHPCVHKEVWFQWCDGTYPATVSGWVECDKPEKFNGIVNWALG
jgi:hypothetical protein